MNLLNERDLRLHVNILGWLYIVGHAFFLVIALFIGMLLPTIGVFSGDPEAAIVLPIVGTAVGIFLTFIALPGILAGYGLLKGRNWGRILAIIVGILGLVNIPIGTVVGVYTLFVLLQESANLYFAPPTSWKPS